MPNLMVALPNIGGALCSTPQSLGRKSGFLTVDFVLSKHAAAKRL